MPLSTSSIVNTYVTSYQNNSDVTVLTDGSWVIVWESYLQDGDSLGIYAQAYNSDGTKKGGEFQVNTLTTGPQTDVSVEALSTGGFVVVYDSFGFDGSYSSIVSQVYDAQIAAVGVETLVNTTTSGSQNNPDLATLKDGGWVVTWQTYTNFNTVVYSQAYNADGTLLGGETIVSNVPTQSQTNAQVLGLSDGGWIVAFEGRDGYSSTADVSITTQRFGADGVAIGGPVNVTLGSFGNTSSYVKTSFDLTELANGGWVLGWENQYSSTQKSSSFKVFDENGSPVGYTLGLSSAYASADPTTPQVVALANGNWVAVQSEVYGDGDGTGIIARIFDSAGNVVTSLIAVNTTTAYDQTKPIVTALSDGSWVVLWQSASDDDGLGYANMFAQSFDANGQAIGQEVNFDLGYNYSYTDPQVSALTDGGWTVTWNAIGLGTTSNEIFTRTFFPLSNFDIAVDITGDQEVGQTITAAISGIDTSIYNVDAYFIWTVDGAIVAAGSDATYTIPAEHEGAQISVSVSLLDPQFDDFSALVATTEVITDGNDAPEGEVTLAAFDPVLFDLGLDEPFSIAQVGHEVSISTFTITDADGTGDVEFTTQWLRSGEIIDGSNGFSHIVTEADVGHKLKLLFTYTDDNGFENEFHSKGIKVAGYTGDVIAGLEIGEQLSGTMQNDLITGGQGDDTLVGFKGNDKLKGGQDDDVLVGNRGTDKLFGNAGDDTLLGGSGGDKLNGGSGNDVLTGGVGADTFIFTFEMGNDVITDFEFGVDELILNFPPDLIEAIYQDGDNTVIGFTPEDSITFLNADVADVIDILPMLPM